jgi:aromatic-L-amino-acid decarboxylase
MTPEEFRRLGYQIVDRIADYRATVAARPVMARTAPGEIKAALPADPPQSPEPFDAILADLDRIVMPGLSHFQHPNFFGYFPSNGELSSVLGDYVSTGLGVLGLSWQSCPALTEIEEVATDWMRRMTGPGMERRDPGHGFRLYADRVALRPRARHQFRAGPRRTAIGSAAAGGLHVGAQPQFGG